MWDERFAGDTFLFGTKPAMGLVRHKDKLIQNGSCFAVADGEGRNSVYLAELGHDVLAMDSSQVGIDKAKKLAEAHQVSVSYELADIYGYDWQKAQFDNVVAIFIQFAPPSKWHEIFEGMKQALRPGGVLILHGYTPKQVEYGTGGPSNVAHLYTTEMLAEAFGDMDILVNEAYEAVLDEGPGHNGQSALVDFVAVKR